MKVFRIETVEGLGPYKIRESGGDSPLRRHFWDEERQPLPHNDGLPFRDLFGDDIPKDFHFGFHSIGRLLSWFNPDERRSLREAGFGIAVYHVPSEEVLMGFKQCVFKKERAERVAFVGVAK